MPVESNVGSISHIITLSVAPVFLLTGIGSMLTVMTNRLARVIDRSRVLEEKLNAGPPDPGTAEELATLLRRAKYVSRAITLCTLTAILICGVVVILFLGEFIAFPSSTPVAILFIAAMVSFMLGLLHFLREILLATATRRIGVK